VGNVKRGLQRQTKESVCKSRRSKKKHKEGRNSIKKSELNILVACWKAFEGRDVGWQKTLHTSPGKCKKKDKREENRAAKTKSPGNDKPSQQVAPKIRKQFQKKNKWSNSQQSKKGKNASLVGQSPRKAEKEIKQTGFKGAWAT